MANDMPRDPPAAPRGRPRGAIGLRAGAASEPGRAAPGNGVGRYERIARDTSDDGWGMAPDLPPLRTEVRDEAARRVIARNDSPDLPFDRSINPYRGCEHGCVYCFARPTHAWLGLSPGLDFESRLVAKPGAAAALEREIGARGYVPRAIALGSNTDPYQPVERDRGITREILAVLSDWGHPVTIVTKGALIERDLDLIAPMAARGLAHAALSVTTLDPGLSRAMEPRAPSPVRRVAAIRALAEAGVPVRVSASPMIPALTDHELEGILEAAAAAGATHASAIPLRLPLEVAPLFRDWLAAHVPDRAARVMGRVRELHGGRDYDPEWHTRMTGRGVWADLLRRRFEVACRRLGLSQSSAPLRCDLFAPPPRPGDQLALL